MHIGVYSSNMAWKKSSYVSKIPPVGKTPNYNCFRVPIHFAANCFTFEKIPPPPPLLQPTIQLLLSCPSKPHTETMSRLHYDTLSGLI